jgi:hypothetical protein
MFMAHGTTILAINTHSDLQKIFSVSEPFSVSVSASSSISTGELSTGANREVRVHNSVY